MMNALYISSLVVTGLIVVALAATLLTVLYLLWRTSDTLGKVLFGVRAIAHRAEPVERLLGEINGALSTARSALADAVPGETETGDPTERRAHARTVHG
jgi:cobalamin biosynthesis protein CobD/CbiB